MTFAQQGEAVAQGQGEGGYAGVGLQGLVEGADAFDGFGRGLGIFLIHAAAEQEVVDGDESAGAQQGEAAFVVVGGGRFVGVDQGEIVAAAAALLDELVERDEGGLEVELDFVLHAGFAPEAARGVGVGDVDVAGGEAAVFRQGEGNGGAAVAGEHADF